MAVVLSSHHYTSRHLFRLSVRGEHSGIWRSAAQRALLCPQHRPHPGLRSIRDSNMLFNKDKTRKTIEGLFYDTRFQFTTSP